MSAARDQDRERAAGERVSAASAREEERADSDDSARAAPSRWSRVRRFAPLLLVSGAIAAVVTLQPHLPKQRQLELRFDDAASIVNVDLSIARVSDQELVQGNTWHFTAGQAPASLRAAANLPDGQYDVDVTVERNGQRQSFHRSIAVDNSNQIAIPVRSLAPPGPPVTD